MAEHVIEPLTHYMHMTVLPCLRKKSTRVFEYEIPAGGDDEVAKG